MPERNCKCKSVDVTEYILAMCFAFAMGYISGYVDGVTDNRISSRC